MTGMPSPLDAVRSRLMGLLAHVGTSTTHQVAEAGDATPSAPPSPPLPIPRHVSDEIHATHWSWVPPDIWPWQNFSPRELASKGNGAVRVHLDAGNRLQMLRTAWGGPLRINSAYRDPVYNARVGGAPLSQHLKGRAFDISVVGFTSAERRRLVIAAASVGFTGFGGYSTFLHVDNARPRVWGQTWAHPKG